MTWKRSCVVAVGLIIALAGLSAAQSVPETSTSAVVPPILRFVGTLPGGSGPLMVTFTLHEEQNGGVALWMERQLVQVDGQGRYAVHLGSASPDGLPIGLFASGQARWLGIQPDEGAELPRVALVSVPYALKAGDAETIAGRPLSAFVLAGDTTGKGADGLTYVNTALLQKGVAAGGAPPSGGTSGTAGYIGRFTDAVNLGNSVIFQNTGNIGIGTTAPEAAFHSTAISAPGAFFDVFSNTLGALPVVHRAARGTPTSPSAVQTDDILGGLAVRGHDGTEFSGGRGQVMFRAAQNWTDTAHGTYLSLTTTALNTTSWAERIRVAPNGYVGFGLSDPLFPIDSRLNRGITYARFGPAVNFGPLFLMANNPHVGFNVYHDGAYRYGSLGAAGYLAFNQDLIGGFSFATASTGNKDETASMEKRLVITNTGRVGIGTVTPSATLDVAGSLSTSGNISTQGAITTTGTLTARAIAAGPGATGTPFAYAVYQANGTRLGGTANIACVWDPQVPAAASRWLCTLSTDGVPLSYTGNSFAAVVTPTEGSQPRIPVTNVAYAGAVGMLVVRLYDLGGNSLQAAFTVVIYQL